MPGFTSRQPGFPVELLAPVAGWIRPHLFKGRAGIQLFHEIEIELAPFELECDGEIEQAQTAFRFDFIQLPGRFGGYRALAGSRHVFPINPEDGYIDGSIYLCHEHVSADATMLEFGDYQDGALRLRATTNVGFDLADPGFFSVEGLKLDVALVPERELTVDQELVRPTEEHRDEALALLFRFIDLAAFEPPFIRRHREWVFSATTG